MKVTHTGYVVIKIRPLHVHVPSVALDVRAFLSLPLPDDITRPQCCRGEWSGSCHQAAEGTAIILHTVSHSIYLHVISWVLGQGSDGAAVVVESVYHLLGAQADHLHMATTANKQPPTQIKTSPTWCNTRASIHLWSLENKGLHESKSSPPSVATLALE